jgi:hypothetical protein
MGHACRLHRLHGLDPTHRRGRLAHQGIPDCGRIGKLCDVDVVDHRNPGRHQREFRQSRPQGFGSRLHQRAMKRRRYRQHQRPLGALRLHQFCRALDGGLVTGNHGLFRFVEIHRLYHLTLRGFGTGFNHGGSIESHHGGHRPFTGRHRRLHGLGTEFHQRYGILQLHHTGGYQCRILAEAVPRHQSRLRAAFFEPQTINGNACGQHQGLSIDGLVQRLGRPLNHQLPQVTAQRSRSFVERDTDHRCVAVSGHHAERLRALAREHKCKFHVDSRELRI